MVNWQDSTTVLNQTQSYIRLEYVLAGAYGWEVLTNIRYDWGILAKKRMSWTPLVYLICRFSGVVTFVLALAGLNARSGINCNVWVVFLFCFGYATTYFASILIALRVIAVWNRNKAMTYVVFLTMVGYLGSFIHGAVTIKGTWDPTHASCVILGITNNMANFSTVLAVDFLLLAAMLSGLLRYRDAGMYRLWRMLWSQGIIWVLLATVAEVPTVVFLSLNLNAPMDLMFFLPEMTVLLVGSTRMYRTLSNFMSTDHIHPSSEIVNSGIGDSHLRHRARMALRLRETETDSTSLAPMEISRHNVS